MQALGAPDWRLFGWFRSLLEGSWGVIIRATFGALITLLITYLLRPLPLQVGFRVCTVLWFQPPDYMSPSRSSK